MEIKTCKPVHPIAVATAGLILALLLALCLPARALAIGLGQIEVRSTLSQPFNARIPLFGASAADLDSISAGLASASLFRKAGVERTPYLFTLKFDVVTTDKHHPYVRITSDKPVKEPSLDFLVQVQTASGTVVRHCVALFSPPREQ